MASARVLIVDDEVDLARAFQWRFEAAGLRALTAYSAGEALAMLQAEHIDLILADCRMPGLDGIEMTRRICGTPAWVAVKVLLFSCHEDAVTRRRALGSGAFDYLPKSIGAARILERVREALSSDVLATVETTEQATARLAAERGVAPGLRALSLSSQQSPEPRLAKSPPGEVPPGPLSSDLGRLATALDAKL